MKAGRREGLRSAGRALLLGAGLTLLPTPLLAADCVVLLHGLLRGAGSMEKLEAALQTAGYAVANVDYPSRAGPIESLAPSAVDEGLALCQERQATPVHFVTHSLGGILLREYLAQRPLAALGRVVMLGPPNQGSEAVDTLERLPGYDLLTGPAGPQLGTEPGDLPRRLPPVDFDLGVIAGNRVFNFLLSWLVPKPNDGPVAVAATRVEGMCAWVVLPATHMFMMRDERVIEQVLAFLRTGGFTAEGASNGLCARPEG